MMGPLADHGRDPAPKHNQHCVDDAAHLDELLPVAAVAGKARHLPRRDRTDLAKADFRDHPVETGTRDTASGRSAEIVIDSLDMRPAERRKTVAHRHIEACRSRDCAGPDEPTTAAHTGL